MVMKPAASIWLGFILLVGLGSGLNAHAVSGNTMERERRKLSVMLLVEGALRSVEKQSIDTRGLHDEINGNKLLHQKKGDSRTLSRTYIKKEFEEDLQNKIDEIFKASGLKDVDPAWCQKSEAEALKLGKTRIEINLSQNFSTAFNEVRSAVVTEQEAELEKFATPESRQDYLKVEKRSPSLHDDLLVRSIEMYSYPIFSENKDYLSRKINDIIDEAWRQYDTQRSIVSESRGVGDSDITVEAIQNSILNEIELYRQSLKNPYDTFPSVQESIVPASKQTASTKFDRWAGSWRYFIAQEKIEKEIQADSVTHRDQRRSREVLKKIYRPEVKRQLFSDYLGMLSPGEEQRLQKFLESQPSFDNQMDMKVDSSLKYFDDTRKVVSQSQFVNNFPGLSNNTWKLDEKAVEKRDTVDTIKDNQKIVQKFLADKKIIEETDELVATAVKRLAGKGDAALNVQKTLVDEYIDRMKANTPQLYNDIADTELEADEFINDLVREATAEIDQSWSYKVLANDYPRLFGIVKDKIRKEIKDLIEFELKKRKDVAQKKQKEREEEIKLKAEDKKEEEDGGGPSPGRGGEHEGPEKGPGEGPGTGTGVGNGGGRGDGADMKKIAPDAIIDIDFEDERSVRVIVNIQDAKPFNFTFQPDQGDYNKFLAMINSHLDEVEMRFKNYLDQKVTETGNEIVYIITRVFHVKVPYNIVYALRERIRNVVIALNIKEKHILWYDGFFLEKADTIPEKIRKRSTSLGTE